MSKNKEIENITTTQANTIVVRFMPWEVQLAKKTQDPEKTLRTLARGMCRRLGKTPKQLIATPLPK